MEAAHSQYLTAPSITTIPFLDILKYYSSAASFAHELQEKEKVINIRDALQGYVASACVVIKAAVDDESDRLQSALKTTDQYYEYIVKERARYGLAISEQPCSGGTL